MVTGSIVALLVANWAVKATVVKFLSMLLKADDGTASVDGFVVTLQAAAVRNSISLTGHFAPSTRSSAAGRTTSSSPGRDT